MANILIVDDDDKARKSIFHSLNSISGHRVNSCFATTEKEAFWLIDQNNFDIVVTDMKMENEESGISVMEHAKKVDASIHTIVITAFANESHKIIANQFGAFGYINKLDSDSYDILRLKVEKIIENNKKYDVFFCYNRDDSQKVKAVKSLLTKEQQILIWMDRDDIELGHRWMDAIIDQIGIINCFCVFYCSKLGPTQEEEVRMLHQESINRDIAIIPVILRGCSKPKDLPIWLEHRQWINLNDIEPDPIKRLADKIKRINSR